MRLTRIDMYSANTEEPITFSLSKADSHAQYQIRSILGLDADEIIQKFYGTSIDGQTRFFDFSLKPREIVMRIVLNPKQELRHSYSKIRDDLYRIISSNRAGGIRLFFNSGASVIAGLTGSISKFEVAYFNKLPEVQLTIRCDDPMFRAINPVVFDGDVLTSISGNAVVPDTISTAPHGFSMQVAFIDDSDNFVIKDSIDDPQWQFKISPIGGFLEEDILYITSEFSNKYVYVDRGGDIIQLSDVVEPGSMWPILFPFPSENNFVITNDAVWVNLEYYAAYWGI